MIFLRRPPSEEEQKLEAMRQTQDFIPDDEAMDRSACLRSMTSKPSPGSQTLPGTNGSPWASEVDATEEPEL